MTPFLVAISAEELLWLDQQLKENVSENAYASAADIPELDGLRLEGRCDGAYASISGPQCQDKHTAALTLINILTEELEKQEVGRKSSWDSRPRQPSFELDTFRSMFETRIRHALEEANERIKKTSEKGGGFDVERVTTPDGVDIFWQKNWWRDLDDEEKAAPKNNKPPGPPKHVNCKSQLKATNQRSHFSSGKKRGRK